MPRSRSHQPATSRRVIDYTTGPELDVCIRALVATMLRMRGGQDPTPEQVDEALEHWKRFYRNSRGDRGHNGPLRGRSG
jgi:hypothetical protein